MAYLRSNILLKSALLVLSLLNLSGCFSDPKTPLRIGVNPWPGYEFLFLAEEKGFFKELGLNIRLVEFNSLSDARRAYEREQLEGLCTTVIEVLQALDQSTRLPRIVRVVDYSHGADVIIGRTEMSDGAALRGKRVGVELGSLGVFILARALEKYQLKLSDVRALSMDQLSIGEGLVDGELDAAVTYPPTSVGLLKRQDMKVLFSTSEIPGEVLDVIAVDQAIIKSRRKEVEKLLRAFDRAVLYSLSNKEESYRIMAARERISPQEFQEALESGIRMVSAADQPNYLRPGGNLQRIVDKTDRILRETGQISAPINTGAIIEPAFYPGEKG